MSGNVRSRLVRSALLSLGLAIPAVVLGLWLMRLFPYHPGLTYLVGWFVALPAGGVASALESLPFAIAWAVGLLAQAMAVFVVLSAWVAITRNREARPRSRRRRAATVLAFLIANVFLTIALLGYLEEIRPPRATPARFVPGEFAALKSKLPEDRPVDFGHVAFARGKLFVASNVGLIEVDGSKVTAIYRWHAISRIDAVWAGPGGQSLWVQHAVTNDLSRLDDAGWRNVALPTPERGYTRGDMLRGFNLATAGADLWLSGGSSLWQWKPDKASWETVPVPDMKSGFESLEVYGSAQQPLLVRGANELFGSETGAVLLRRDDAGGWSETQLPGCCVKDLTALADAIYFRGKKGSLIRIAGEKPETITAPGRVEAIGAANGQLIVSVSGVGVFSFAGAWKRIFDAPIARSTDESWAHLATHGDVVAISIDSLSKSKQDPASAGLWISVGPQLVRIEVPD